MHHNRVGSHIAFLLRHSIAAIVSITLPTLLTIMVYLILLLVAFVGGLPLGSLIALTRWVLAILLVSLVYTLLFLFPAVWFSEMLSGRLTLSPFIQIFLSTVNLFVLVHLVFGVKTAAQ